jgi:hypothetical protein
MKLKSFGCSFIFGSELADDRRILVRENTLTGSYLTWPALMSQHLGYTYRCYARPGTGNLQIAEQVLTHAVNPEIALFVIGWTWIDRFDYTNATISQHTQDRPWQNWHTILPIDDTPLAKTYYKDLHSEYRDKLTTLMSIRLVIDTLTQRGIPFIMTYMDDLIFDQQWNITPAVTDLQEYVRQHLTTFDDLNFLDWSKKNGYPITKIGHPLEAAHSSAADYMINAFDTQKTNGLSQ